MWTQKFFIDFNKEEKWLNDMARKGYELRNSFFVYQFRVVKPEESNYKIDCRMFKNRVDFIEYCTLFEDSGWKHIRGNWYSGTQYFKKMNESGNDDIFSDSVSKAGRYKRMSSMWLSIALAYFTYLVVFILTSDGFQINKILHPRLLYLTPDLWELSGVQFWFSFLIETPFALGRGYLWLLFLMVFALYTGFTLKARKLMKKS